MLFRAPQPHTRGYRASSGGSGTVVAKKNVGFVDGFRFNGQDPVSRRGKATGRGAFQVQSAQAIRAAYYFDLAARDYILADGAIEPVIERVPCSAFIEPSQSSELIFNGQSDRLRGRKHPADGGKFLRDLQEQNRPAMKGESMSRHGFNFTCHPRFRHFRSALRESLTAYCHLTADRWRTQLGDFAICMLDAVSRR